MIMTCGLGAFVVAIFHLLAHGCYKAFFFLSTGNALRSVDPGRAHSSSEHHAPQRIGVLHGGALLLALIPPLVLFSGSYEFLWGVTGFASAAIGFKIIGLITVFVAAIHIFSWRHVVICFWPQDLLAVFRNECFGHAIHSTKFCQRFDFDGPPCGNTYCGWGHDLVLELVRTLPGTGIDLPPFFPE